MTRRKSKNLGALAEIALLSPWVVGMRLARFADTSPRSRKRNVAEATRMTSEKGAALLESSWAAGAAMMRAQWGLIEAMTSAGIDVATAATQPVRRRVRKNARRLRRT
jgi:geranylgeranyl pyrophosphate synthase